MDISSIKVLVVDDDPDIVEILKYNLKNSGYSVTVSYTHLTLPTMWYV